MGACRADGARRCRGPARRRHPGCGLRPDTRGHHAHCSGDLNEARALLSEAARLTAGEGSPATQEAFAHAFLGLVLTDLDRVDEGSEVFERGRRLGLERGSAISARVTDMAQSVAAVSVGALER